MAERPCCAAGGHDDAALLTADLLAGGPDNSVRKVAERYGLTRTAISNHRACLGLRGVDVPPADTSDGATGHPPEERDTREETPPAPVLPPAARSILDESRRFRNRAKKLLGRIEAGDESVDFRGAAALLAQLRGLLELEARILGELKAASTTVNVYASPDWHALRDGILDVLADEPAALARVIAFLAAREPAAPAAALH